MNNIRLDERLLAVSNFVRQGSIAADVGTDHAFLPVYLVQNRICKRVIACDINRLPLESAKRTVGRYSLECNIELRLSDGLQAINKGECSDIIIAGMGAELISEIINRCEWIRNRKINLILNPMTKPELLRRFLYANGFDILAETAVVSQAKHYTIINAVFDGKKSEPSLSEIWFGKLTDKNDAASREYINMTANRMLKKANGMLCKNSGDEFAVLLKQTANSILGENIK